MISRVCPNFPLKIAEVFKALTINLSAFTFKSSPTGMTQSVTDFDGALTDLRVRDMMIEIPFVKYVMNEYKGLSQKKQGSIEFYEHF